MSDEYAQGQRDGLRLASAILAAEEAKWSALLGQSPARRTNAARQVRHKTLQVAQKRLETALNQLTPKGGKEAQRGAGVGPRQGRAVKACALRAAGPVPGRASSRNRPAAETGSPT